MSQHSGRVETEGGQKGGIDRRDRGHRGEKQKGRTEGRDRGGERRGIEGKDRGRDRGEG